MKHLTRTPYIVLSAALLLSGCGHHENTSPEDLPAVEVSVATAKKQRYERSQWLPGTVHPAEQAVIASKLMATVESADLAIGQSVRAGDLLVRLKADEIEAKLAQAEAGLAQVERNYIREKALLEQNATTAETVRTLEDQLRLAKAQLEEAKTMDSYRSIRAPFDGIITRKNVRRGDLATPGMPLLSIEGEKAREIHVQVPDSLSALPDGSEVTIEADGRTLMAIVTEVSPAADTASRTRLAKLAPRDNGLRSGQYVRVNWPAGFTESVWIPAVAVSPLGQMQRVFTVADGTARLHLVRTGIEKANTIQILAGLDADSRIILNPPAHLRDGQPVVVKQ